MSLYNQIRDAVNSMNNEGINITSLQKACDTPMHRMVLQRANVCEADYEMSYLLNIIQLACFNVFEDGIPEVLEEEEVEPLDEEEEEEVVVEAEADEEELFETEEYLFDETASSKDDSDDGNYKLLNLSIEIFPSLLPKPEDEYGNIDLQSFEEDDFISQACGTELDETNVLIHELLQAIDDDSTPQAYNTVLHEHNALIDKSQPLEENDSALKTNED